jgi:NDP-sugar pyrophosphorylase family protein
MWPQARTSPKTVLPVAGRPFASWQLDWLADAGVTDVVYCIGYLGQQVRDHVGDGSAWGLNVRYVDEGSRLLGTGGALRLAADERQLDDRFLVLYGDSWLQVDPGAVYEAATARRVPALMTVYENLGQHDASNVVYRNGMVTRYEKDVDPPPRDMRWIDYGLAVLVRDVVVAQIPAGTVTDLSDLYGRLAAEGSLAGFPVADRFYEIGSTRGYEELVALLQERRGGGERP